MLWRKCQSEIKNWIKNEHKALMISGARQIGKTYIIRHTLTEEKCDFVEFNLIERPELKELFNGITKNNCKSFLERLTIATDHNLIKGKTIIFFDEIQECKDIVTKIKFLVEDASFKYILSGSLLGVELTGIKSAPVGYMNTIEMFPMDFEEYLIALKIKRETINLIKNCFDTRTKVDEFIHGRLMEAFKSYLIVGGMPEAVQSYVKDGDYNKIVKIHLNIIEQYKVDFTKYEKEMKLKLIKTYELIPAELADKNKRYIFADLDPDLKFDRYENSFNWLIDSGVALPVYNISEPRLPIEINKKSNLFKLFLSDVGLLSSLYGKTTQLAILDNDNSLNCGAIYENIVAQELHSHGFKGYYFNSRKQGELDFVIEYNDCVCPIEVKSGKDYTKHSALDNVINNKDYNVKNAFVLSNYNVSIDGKIVYLPIYMVMFITNNLELPRFKALDLSDL